MCDIYRLQYYRNCCFNDVQFDIISILQKTNKTLLQCAVKSRLD